jgi:von Willebrand factor type A domain/Putative Flp pilus-assembly TadE/G-like
MVLFTLMLPTMLIPMAGLGIDATMLYIVQAKLSAAVDGAALGAGRLLGTPADPKEIAGEFLKANFHADGTAGFWKANNLVPTIDVTLGTTKTIKVNAAVDVPLLFAQIFGYKKTTVTAAATATRKDSRVVWVIDRSNSMNQSDGSGGTVIGDVKSFTLAHVQDFTPGVDEVGLVVYDGSGVVGYPPVRPWDPTTTSASTGGPDINFASGSSTDILHQITAINAAWGTGMADALSIAYIELQKAHMKDLLQKGVDDKLNSIVLFTDGVPSAVTLFPNNPANSNGDNIVLSTGCTYRNISTNNTAQKMFGYVTVGGPAFSGTNQGYGLYGLASLDSASALSWMANAGGDTKYPNPQTPFAGCTSMMSQTTSVNSSLFNSFSKIPASDKYGNALNGAGYKTSHMVGGTKGLTSIYTGTNFNASKPTDSYQWGLAMWNAADSAAQRIRTDANLANRPGDTQNMAIEIFAIGYTGTDGTDDALLRRIANDKSATGYDPTQPTGLYIGAADKDALAAAFATIASAILRLAQ